MANITIEQISDGIYRIHSTYCGDSIAVTAEEAYELFEGLYQMRDTLYQAVQHPDEEEQMHLRMQSLADRIVTGDSTIYRGGNDG